MSRGPPRPASWTNNRFSSSSSLGAAGTLYLFDRKAVRFFRKDGHDWQKKKDGKTVRETHEKLKVGNVELLNCYYAHSAEDNRFQRRCYWLLNSDEGLVLVHYLRVSDKSASMRRVMSGSSLQPALSDGPNGFRNLFGVPGDPASDAAPPAGGGQTQSGTFSVSGGAFSADASLGGGVVHPEYAAVSSHQNPHQSAQFYSREAGDGRGGDFGSHQRLERWYDGIIAGDAQNEYGANDPELEALMAMDTDGGANGHSMEYGYTVLREFAQQQHAQNVAAAGPANRQRRDSDSLMYGAGMSTNFSGLTGVSSLMDEGGDEMETADAATATATAAAAAAAAAGPNIGTTFPASSPAHVAPSTNLAATFIVPGSFEDGVRTMQELEERVAELQQSLDRVASSAVDEAQGQLARLERDMSALESGHRALARSQSQSHPPASRSHVRKHSFDRRAAAKPRPVSWDAEEDDDGADEEEEDGDDDDKDDDEGEGEGALSPLAKAAAATRRPRVGPGSVSRLEFSRNHAAAAPPKPPPRRPSVTLSGSEIELTDAEDRAASPAAAAALARASAHAARARANRPHRAPPAVPHLPPGAQILWEINDFSPEWDGESGGAKVIISGAPRPGTPEGLNLSCVFGSVEVRADQISPGVLRCRAPPHPPGRVPFYVSCIGGGKRPVSDVRTFEFRDASTTTAKNRRAAEVRLATGVTERDFQLRLVHLLIGADRSSKHSAGEGGGGGGSGAGSGGGSGSGGGDSPGGATANDTLANDTLGGRGSGSGGRGSGSRDGSASADSGGGSGDSAPRAMDADADGRGSESAPRNLSPIPDTTPTKISGGGGGGGGGGGTAGASFARKAVAALGIGDFLSDPDAASDEDVARTFKTALEARLRYAISAEAKSFRARAATASEGGIPVPTFSQPRTAYARVDAGGVGVIHCVAALGMNWAIPAMCKSGCDVNQPDRRHRTALHWAAAKGHEDTVATLLASGANIRATARWGAGGYTAADLAAANGHGGIAAYISETSLAASLSNISLYGGPSGAVRRPNAGVPVHPRRPGSGLSAHRVGTASRLPAQSAAGGALEGVSSPMVADVKSPGGGIPAGARASRVTGGAPKMPSLLLATETEVTATDFDSRTDLTDLETDAGEHLGGAGMGDEERREKMAAGMIQLAFRKHAVRRRKLRRKVAGSGLGSVEEVAEAKTKTKTPGEDDDSEDDEDVKKDVKKVVKKAEKAALKITSSIRSLKTNKNQPTEDPGLGKRGRRSGGESREHRGVKGKNATTRDDAAARAAEEMPRTPSEQAIADVRRRVERLRARAVVLTEEVHQRGGTGGSAPLLPPRTTYRRRVPAGDIMQLVKVSGLAGSAHKLEALQAMRGSASKSSKVTAAGTSESEGKNGGEANAGEGEEEEDGENRGGGGRLEGSREEDGVESGIKSGIKSGLRRAGRKTDDDDDDDDDDEEEDEEEEDAKVAVSRIQAIVRSRQAREQYLRLRSVTMSLQERIAARARGETPVDDADGEDIEVDDEDED